MEAGHTGVGGDIGGDDLHCTRGEESVHAAIAELYRHTCGDGIDAERTQFSYPTVAEFQWLGRTRAGEETSQRVPHDLRIGRRKGDDQQAQPKKVHNRYHCHPGASPGLTGLSYLI